jgi:hypothetical protein
MAVIAGAAPWPATSPAAAGVSLGRCNPYGAETGGPQRVLGGLHGPGSAATPGMHLPAAVAQGEWACRQQAQLRCRMVCRCQHTGQVMPLCSWHDEVTFSGEMVAGTLRQVKSTIRVRGHYEEISRRQAGSCPRCLFPGVYASLYKDSQALAWELAQLAAAGLWRSEQAQRIRQRAADIGKAFDEANALGIVHNCPMTLVPVS